MTWIVTCVLPRGRAGGAPPDLLRWLRIVVLQVLGPLPPIIALPPWFYLDFGVASAETGVRVVASGGDW